MAASEQQSETALRLAVVALVIAVFVALGEAYTLLLRYFCYHRVKAGPLLHEHRVDSGAVPGSPKVVVGKDGARHSSMMQGSV